jgi:ACR3 family arsenite efflux pump ArsB
MLFVVPAIAMVICWRKLVMGWQTEPHTIAGIACLTVTSAAVLLAFTALWWVQFVKAIPTFDYRVERWGLLLSVVGIVAGFATRQKQRQRYLGLALAAAAWTFALFFLAASTY